MEVIKKINHNAAVCLDSVGNEIIAIGTGIGFPSVPYNLEDLSKIQQTYYNINPMYLDLLNQIPEKIFSISSQIVELFKTNINYEISSNLVFTLADHLNFAIERYKKNIIFENPLQYEIQHLYEKEYQIGLDSLGVIYREFDIRLPRAEVTNIALHLINAVTTTSSERKSNQFDLILSEVVEIIGDKFQICVDRNSVSYSRFVSHFQYLLKNEQTKNQFSSENYKLINSVIEEYPKTYEVASEIKIYLKQEFNFKLQDEEILYLMLHINRLCTRENYRE